MKSLQISAKCALAGTAALLFCVPAAHAETYWAKGVSKTGGWHDIAKTWSNDSEMCWAASGSNIIWWWQDKFVIPSRDCPPPVPTDGRDIWDYVKNSFSNGVGLPTTVWRMWFDGIGSNGGFYKDRSGFPLAQAIDDKTDVQTFLPYGLTKENISNMVKTKFEDGWGLSIGVTEKQTGYQHAITVWGAELTNGLLSKIWITDSDDRRDALVEFSVEAKENFYITPETYAGFFDRGKDYYIHKYMWLDSNADFLTMIPEPSAFGLLAGTLALVLAGTRRRKKLIA